jgi:hypothetical protein
MKRTALQLLAIAILVGGLAYFIRTSVVSEPSDEDRRPVTAPAPARPVERARWSLPAPTPTAPESVRAPALLRTPRLDAPPLRPGTPESKGSAALPSDFAELVPQPKGAVVEEVRRLPDGGYWVALVLEGQAVAEVARTYREGLAEKMWRVVTPGTDRGLAQSLANRGLASAVEAQEVVVGQGYRRAVAILLQAGADQGSTRVEVSFLAQGPRRPQPAPPSE